MNHNENKEIERLQDPEPLDGMSHEELDRIEDLARQEYEDEKMREYEELQYRQNEAGYHHPNCPRFQFWDAGEFEAPCACEFMENEGLI